MAWRDWSVLMETINSTCDLVGNDANWMIGLPDANEDSAGDMLKKSVNDVLKKEPTVLPLWDPMGALA